MITTENIEAAIDRASAWALAIKLASLSSVGMLADNILVLPHQPIPIFVWLAPLAYIPYLMLLATRESIEDAEAATASAQASAQAATAAFAKAVALAKEAKAQASASAEASARANEVVQSLQVQVQTLEMDKRLLQAEAQTLQTNIQTLAAQRAEVEAALQAAARSGNAARAELADMKRSLAAKEAEAEAERFRKGVLATWSASGKNHEAMNTKYGDAWLDIVNP